VQQAGDNHDWRLRVAPILAAIRILAPVEPSKHLVKGAQMGLDSSDTLPAGISYEDAYAAIRTWYQAHVDRYAMDPQWGGYPAESKAYIESLPAPGQATLADIKTTLHRVLTGGLEWGYHQSDGRFKMAAYAQAAFEAAGDDPFAG
jgi:hypothetical protein